MRDIVIVGGGEAGGRAAIELRKAGFAGNITLIGEETHAPYERPPLSKAAIGEESTPSPQTIADGARLTDINVERISGVAVVAIDPRDRTVTLGDARRLKYDALVLATGARARALSLPGAEHALTLRSFEDALRVRERLRAAGRVIVIGGGFIGLELAAAARALECEVTVMEADTRLLRRSTPERFAAALEARHKRESVEILKGVRINRLTAAAGVVVVHSDVGARAVDVVIAGVGAAPRTELAVAAGLAVENGILVDARLRTSDPHIFAIGDCVNFPHAFFDGRRMRLEAWRNAFDQGVHVAKAILGVEDPFVAMPRFWSDQYDLTLQIVGLPDAGVSTVLRDLGGGAEMLFHLDAKGRLVAAGGLGAIEKIGKEIKLSERLIARRASPASDALADPGVNLKKLT